MLGDKIKELRSERDLLQQQLNETDLDRLKPNKNDLKFCQNVVRNSSEPITPLCVAL